MRFSSSLCRIISSPFLCNNTPSSIGRRLRHFQNSQTRQKEPTIFQGSLEKTLEVHRAFNRASLVRKVVSQSDTEKKSHPAALPEISHEDNQSLRLDVAPKIQYLRPPRPRRAERKPELPFTRLATAPSQPVRWNIDLKDGRPEQRPWLEYADQGEAVLDGISQLDHEIRALEQYLSPPSQEAKGIELVASKVTKILKGIAPNPPQVIGSRRTGFAMSHSGLDFLLPVQDLVCSSDSFRKPSSTRPKMLSLHSGLLRNVEKALRQSNTYSNTRVQPAGRRHHVLVATHQPTGLQLRFYCGEDLPASIEYIWDFNAEYPSIRPLYMATRLILESQGLFGGDHSSLTPDALLMLLASFLKMNHGRFHRADGCGKLLLDFLYTYGLEVNLTTTGVAVDPPGLFNIDSVKKAGIMYTQNNPDEFPAHLRGQRALLNMKKRAASRRNASLATQLCLQDPSNYMNDLGRSCSRTLEVQGAFARAYARMRESVDQWKLHESDGLGRSVLGSALRANFKEFGNRRDLLCSPV